MLNIWNLCMYALECNQFTELYTCISHTQHSRNTYSDTATTPTIVAQMLHIKDLIIFFITQALVIGVRKCGTRALLEMLYLHPRIQKAAGEVHFFDRDENYNRGLEWYRKKMPHSFSGQITIEKSPSYFVTPEVSVLICVLWVVVYLSMRLPEIYVNIKEILFLFVERESIRNPFSTKPHDSPLHSKVRSYTQKIQYYLYNRLLFILIYARLLFSPFLLLQSQWGNTFFSSAFALRSND